jgi:hypothetical protein
VLIVLSVAAVFVGLPGGAQLFHAFIYSDPLWVAGALLLLLGLFLAPLGRVATDEVASLPAPDLRLDSGSFGLGAPELDDTGLDDTGLEDAVLANTDLEDAPIGVGKAHVGTAHVGTAHVGTAHVGAAHVGAPAMVSAEPVTALTPPRQAVDPLNLAHDPPQWRHRSLER